MFSKFLSFVRGLFTPRGMDVKMPAEATISMIVTRANGDVEDLGVVWRGKAKRKD